MTRVQYLLTKLAEECNETAQRASKAIVFGLDDIQSGQLEDNAKRLVGEFCHILAYMELLRDEGYLELDEFDMEHEIEEKKKELDRWYQYSIDKGMVEPEQKTTIISVPIEQHFAGGYRLEYDGKYITLFGKDNRHEQFRFSDDQEIFYEAGRFQSS